MATLKQLSKAYLNLIKARRRLSFALSDAQNCGLIKCPDYNEGYWKRINEIDDLIEKLSKDALADATQAELKKELWK